MNPREREQTGSALLDDGERHQREDIECRNDEEDTANPEEVGGSAGGDLEVAILTNSKANRPTAVAWPSPFPLNKGRSQECDESLEDEQHVRHRHDDANERRVRDGVNDGCGGTADRAVGKLHGMPRDGACHQVSSAILASLTPDWRRSNSPVHFWLIHLFSERPSLKYY